MNKIQWISLLIGLWFISSCAPEEDANNNITVDLSGSWQCKEITSNPANTTTFSVSIAKGSSTDSYTIQNIYALGSSAKANISVSGSDISMPQQTVGSGNGTFSINGSGKVNSSNNVSLSYQVDDGSGSVDNCTATLTR